MESSKRALMNPSLETPARAWASSCQAVGTTWFFSSCGGILELRWMKAQHEGTLTSPCIVWKNPPIPLTAPNVDCHLVNNSR